MTPSIISNVCCDLGGSGGILSTLPTIGHAPSLSSNNHLSRKPSAYSSMRHTSSHSSPKVSIISVATFSYCISDSPACVTRGDENRPFAAAPPLPDRWNNSRPMARSAGFKPMGMLPSGVAVHGVLTVLGDVTPLSFDAEGVGVSVALSCIFS